MSHPTSAEATLESLQRIFTVPESPDSTLAKLDRELSENLHGFLRDRIVALEKDIADIEADFSQSQIPEQPSFVSEHTDFLLNHLVAHSVHTAAPGFIGHMTSALPYFMLPLSKIMIALNQNLVKIETSKAFTPLERQLLGMVHRLLYREDDAFYEQWMHQSDHALGTVCSGGTIANITALWVARNRAFPATEHFAGAQQLGLSAALEQHGYRGAVVVVSELGHYSLSKAADVLGIGCANVIRIPADRNFRVRTKMLVQKCQDLEVQGYKILSIVGLAGATETGAIDPLPELAEIAQSHHCHFHVDAAWGGPTLFSNRYAGLLKGIELADSVTIDAHKQLYAPLSSGMVLFKNPHALNAIAHHAAYIIRKGSKDLGATSLEGSRSGAALLAHAGLHIIGRQGYELLINQGIERARYFAEMIANHPQFELVSAPQLNILTYRLVPPGVTTSLKTASTDQYALLNERLNQLTIAIQKIQRQRGKHFVSRTTLQPFTHRGLDITVFRVVLANPLTTETLLADVLEEQVNIAQEPEQQALINSIQTLANNSVSQE